MMSHGLTGGLSDGQNNKQSVWKRSFATTNCKTDEICSEEIPEEIIPLFGEHSFNQHTPQHR